VDVEKGISMPSLKQEEEQGDGIEIK